MALFGNIYYGMSNFSGKKKLILVNLFPGYPRFLKEHFFFTQFFSPVCPKQLNHSGFLTTKDKIDDCVEIDDDDNITSTMQRIRSWAKVPVESRHKLRKMLYTSMLLQQVK